MRIALAQMEVVAGKPQKNLETILRMIEEAKREHVDLIAFPEMCLGGYLVGDKWLDDAYCRNLMRYNDKIREASKGIAVAWGNVYWDGDINSRVGQGAEGYHPNKDGRTRKYNAVYVAQDGEWAKRRSEVADDILPQGIHLKTLLPNYRFFDDQRYFFSAEDIAKDFLVPLEVLEVPFRLDIDSKEVPVGFEVCEDLWCADYRKNGEAINPTRMLIDNGAEFIVNVSASPWTYGKNGARDRRIQFLKKDSGDKLVPFFYVNHVGAQNNGKNVITFDGGSTVYNKSGDPVVFAAEQYQEEIIIVDEKDLQGAGIERVEKTMIAQKYDAIVRGVRHVKDMQGRTEQPKYLVGLSGGVDSAVEAAILVEAVGNKKVYALNIPTRHNSSRTIGAAEYVADQLDIGYIKIPIQELVELNEAVLEEADLEGNERKLTTLNKENVQAKIRGTSVLSNMSAKYGALFTCNANKLEMAIGYTTLYGDLNGAIAPLADLTKPEIFELARYINERAGREIIPESMIPDHLFRFREDQIVPSAELKDKQIDPMKFGYHDALLAAFTDYKKKGPEDVMRWYLDGSMEAHLPSVSTELLERWNVTDPKEFIKDLDWFCRGIAGGVFKRVQAPPVVITSKSAWGYDIRESILPYEETEELKELKAQVLQMNKYQPKEAAGEE